MFCTRCGRPLPEGAQFCTACGEAAGATGAGPPRPSSSEGSDSLLLSASPLMMVWDKLSTFTNYQFQDASGQVIGSTQGEFAFPIKYTVFDERQQVALTLDAKRVRGLRYDFLIHDPTGAVLATIHQESSVLSRKYSMTVGDRPDWTLTTDAMGYHYEIAGENGGIVVATGDRKPAIRTSTTEIRIAAAPLLDHRVILGAMVLVCYLSTRK